MALPFPEAEVPDAFTLEAGRMLFAGPVDFHERLGEAIVTYRGEEVARVPLLAALEVPAAGFGRRLQNFLTEPWMLLVLGAILLAATAATQRRGPSQRPTSRRPPAEEPT